MLLPIVPQTTIALPVTLDDDAGATSTGGSLATATLGVLHFAVVTGYVASSVLTGPRRERVSCILVLSLTVCQGHVRALSGLHYDGLEGRSST